ncbi:MAG TPA: hypothetical protein DCW31_06700 [Lactobacillus sp.]|nr:hypothetical protein [Lactobacillus sp.]
MTTIYVAPGVKQQSVELSDGSRGEVQTKTQGTNQIRYSFDFNYHLHPSFWIDRPLKDGMTVNVQTLDGPEQFKIEYR